MTKDMVIWLISLVMAQILRRKQPLSKILFFIFQKDYRLMQRNIFIYDSAMPGSSWMVFLHNLSGF